MFPPLHVLQDSSARTPATGLFLLSTSASTYGAAWYANIPNDAAARTPARTGETRRLDARSGAEESVDADASALSSTSPNARASSA